MTELVGAITGWVFFMVGVAMWLSEQYLVASTFFAGAYFIGMTAGYILLSRIKVKMDETLTRR